MACKILSLHKVISPGPKIPVEMLLLKETARANGWMDRYERDRKTERDQPNQRGGGGGGGGLKKKKIVARETFF